jgi:hypothetical protein
MILSRRLIDIRIVRKGPTTKMRSCGYALALLIVASGIAGCGSKTGPERVAVAGSVSIDGAPIKSGCIRFIPTETTKGPAAVAEIKEGAYELGPDSGPIAGTLRVEIEATGFQEFELDDERAYAERAAKGKPALKKNPVPPIYNRNSRLTARLTARQTHKLDFPLTSPGKTAARR